MNIFGLQMANRKFVFLLIFVKYHHSVCFPEEPALSILTTIPHHEKLQELIKVIYINIIIFPQKM